MNDEYLWASEPRRMKEMNAEDLEWPLWEWRVQEEEKAGKNKGLEWEKGRKRKEQKWKRRKEKRWRLGVKAKGRWLAKEGKVTLIPFILEDGITLLQDTLPLPNGVHITWGNQISEK